jgi:hypothetical protein
MNRAGNLEEIVDAEQQLRTSSFLLTTTDDTGVSLAPILHSNVMSGETS